MSWFGVKMQGNFRQNFIFLTDHVEKLDDRVSASELAGVVSPDFYTLLPTLCLGGPKHPYGSPGWLLNFHILQLSVASSLILSR